MCLSKSQDDDSMAICLSESIPPKGRFWKDEQRMTSGFSNHFSTICSPNRVLTPLKKCFENPDFIRARAEGGGLEPSVGPVLPGRAQ
jgi:hypothetical protein